MVESRSWEGEEGPGEGSNSMKEKRQTQENVGGATPTPLPAVPRPPLPDAFPLPTTPRLTAGEGGEDEIG